MTIYGGADRGDGIRLDGFLISCCRCGWHSQVVWYGNVIYCKRCENKYVNKDKPTEEEYAIIAGGEEG